MDVDQIVSAAIKIAIVLSYFLCFIVVLVVWDLYRKRHIFKFTRDFKGYNFYPVIGNGYHTIGKDIFTVVENAKKENGLPCAIWNGHDCHYITIDASEIKVILNHPNAFNKGTLYHNFRTAFENTILLAKYDSWKRNRKIFSKSFSQPILNSFVDVFYDKACTLVDILKDSNSRDKYDIFCKVSLDNFCANVMGLDLDAQYNTKSRLSHLIDRLQTVIGKRAFTSYFYPEYLFIFSMEGREMWKNYMEIRNFIYSIIQDKRQVFEKNKDFRENNNKLPLMDMMLEAEGDTFTDEEIFEEIALFTLAATDTSGVTLTFTFTLLGMNPKAQEKIYEEVKQTVGLEGPICYSDVPNLKYTGRAIFEAMRLLPVTPALERHSAAEIDLGDKKLPAGMSILISVFNLHRSEAYWKNPLEYDPDRFLPEEVEKRDPYAFIPFSGGPRNCIGMKYALMMMTTTVAHVIRKYEVRSKYKSVEEMEFESLITMKTVHPIDCTFIPRHHSNNV